MGRPVTPFMGAWMYRVALFFAMMPHIVSGQTLNSGTVTITSTLYTRVALVEVTEGYSIEVIAKNQDGSTDVSTYAALTSCQNSVSFNSNSRYTDSSGASHNLVLGKDGCMQFWMQINQGATSKIITYEIRQFETLTVDAVIYLIIAFAICACAPVIIVLALLIVAAAVFLVVFVIFVICAVIFLVVFGPWVLLFIILFWPCIILASATGSGIFGFFHWRKTNKKAAIYALMAPVYLIAIPFIPIILVGLLLALSVRCCNGSFTSKIFQKKVSASSEDSGIRYNPDDVEVQEFVLQEDDSMPLPIAIGDSDDEAPEQMQQTAANPVAVEEVEIPFHQVEIDYEMPIRLPRVIEMVSADPQDGGITAFPVADQPTADGNGIQAFPVNNGPPV